MANIMINESCNLKCPYCFADEYVNKCFKSITDDDFEKALNFALSSGNDERIGIIGGEPTLHPHFKEYLIKLIEDARVRNVTIFTNGTNISGFEDELCHPKIHLLINCNSPTNTGQVMFDKLCTNVEYLVNKKHMKDRITLGINMYKPDFEFDYILDLLKLYKFTKVRTSVSVPNDLQYLNNPIEYFRIMTPHVLEFFELLAKNGIAPFFDCNNIPGCVWSENERLAAANRFKATEKETNIFDTSVRCTPVIDILPDLSVIRCFGMSEYEKKHIDDFRNISDARGYFIKNVDNIVSNVCHSEDCKQCYAHETGQCNGGCMRFSVAKMFEFRKHINN